MNGAALGNLWLAVTALVCLVVLFWVVPQFGTSVAYAVIGSYLVVRLVGLAHQVYLERKENRHA